MKRFSSLLLAGCLCAFAFAPAQEGQQTQAPPPPPAARGHHMPTVDEQVAHLTKRLSLSPEQQTNLRPILQAQHEKMQQLMDDTSTPREQKHVQMKAIHDSSQSQIRELLNDDQKKSFDEFAQQHGRHMHHRQDGAAENGAPPPPD